MGGFLDEYIRVHYYLQEAFFSFGTFLLPSLSWCSD